MVVFFSEPLYALDNAFKNGLFNDASISKQGGLSAQVLMSDIELVQDCLGGVSEQNNEILGQSELVSGFGGKGGGRVFIIVLLRRQFKVHPDLRRHQILARGNAELFSTISSVRNFRHRITSHVIQKIAFLRTKESENPT